MEFKVPEMGEGVMEGELVSWKIAEGDSIADDQTLCEVMTDKATVEVPSPFSGKITKLMAKEGDTVSVGQSILSYEGGAGSKKTPEAPASTEAVQKPTETTAPISPAPSAAPSPAAAISSGPSFSSPETGTEMVAGPDGQIAAAPATRRLARELGVDLSRVPGTGPSGRIVKTDIEKFLNGAGAIPIGAPSMARMPTGGEEVIPFKGLRKKIAENMRLSKDRVAHFTYVDECDVTELVKLRKQAKEIGLEQGVKVTFLPFIMKAMVAALRQYPMLNSTLDEESGQIIRKHYYNISLSIQTDDGLTAPVVKHVERKSIMDLSRDITDIVERARTKKLTREDFEGGTITLTNAGTIGGLFTTPIVNYPQVAILGFNKIFKKPIVKTVRGQDRVVARDWTYFSISLDHRIVDGAEAAHFMNLFMKYVENPNLLTLESI